MRSTRGHVRHEPKVVHLEIVQFTALHGSTTPFPSCIYALQSPVIVIICCFAIRFTNFKLFNHFSLLFLKVYVMKEGIKC
jgi:hypothetical protein